MDQRYSQEDRYHLRRRPELLQRLVVVLAEAQLPDDGNAVPRSDLTSNLSQDLDP